MMGRIQGTILLICAAAVGGALTLQYFFGAQPCYLCIVERSFFMAIGLMALLAISFPAKYLSIPLLCVQTGLVICLGNTFYQHIGIYRGWWPSSCDMNPTFFMSEYIPYIFDVKALCGQNDFPIMGYDMVYWGAATTVLLWILVLWSMKAIYSSLFD